MKGVIRCRSSGTWGTCIPWDAGASARKSHVITFSALTVLVLLADTLDAKGEISDTGMAQVSSVSFSPDGSRIVGGGPSLDYSSGTLKVWDAGASALIPLNPHAQN